MLQTIKQTTEEFLEAMGFTAEVDVSQNQDAFLINITSSEADYLIGSRGANLKSLHHILKLVLRTRIQEPIVLNLDVNEYRKKREEFLKEIARNLAEKAKLSQKTLTLKPMSGYERRIIHLELASCPYVTTESIGEEPYRRLVVKPYP